MVVFVYNIIYLVIYGVFNDKVDVFFYIVLSFDSIE